MSGELLKICGVALLCAVMGMMLRNLKGEFALLARIGAGILIFALLIPQLSDTVERLTSLFSTNGVGEYASVMVRALGIALLGKLCGDLCRDAGESGLAGGVELAGKLAILALCFPLIEQILGYARALLEES